MNFQLPPWQWMLLYAALAILAFYLVIRDSLRQGRTREADDNAPPSTPETRDVETFNDEVAEADGPVIPFLKVLYVGFVFWAVGYVWIFLTSGR
jgi:hypothetical protein